MDLYVLSVAILLVMVLAIYAMTRGDAIEAEIQRLVHHVPVEQIYDEYRSNNNTLSLFVLGGIMLTGAFALIFFGAGGLDPRLWDLTNWIFAVIGLTATIAITLGQRSLYSSIKQNIAALLVTSLILTFVIFSEVATSSEREDSLVRDRSLNSPTLAAVLNKIGAADQIPASRADYYYAEAARYESLAKDCSGQCKRANRAKAEGYKAQARHEDSKMKTALLAQRETKKALIAESKNLEYLESNHTAVVRWLKEISTGTYTAAMMFASLIFVIAFESGFHFTGTRNGIYIEALSRLGYSVKRNKKRSGLRQQQTAEATTQQGSSAITEHKEPTVSAVRAQPEQAKQWNIEQLWDNYKSALQSGELGLTARQQKAWFSRELADCNQKWVIADITALADRWQQRAAEAGILLDNPKYTPTNRKPKYILAEGSADQPAHNDGGFAHA